MSAFINGIQHSWGSIETQILGRKPTGITQISYEDKQEKVNNYGRGRFPVSRGLGKYEASAKITLLSYEVDAIQEALSQGQRLTDIEPFDIVVSYLPEGSASLVQHTLRNCEFTSNKREISEGDTMISTEFELIISHIDWS